MRTVLHVDHAACAVKRGPGEGNRQGNPKLMPSCEKLKEAED